MRCEQSERWISLGADQELSVQEVGLLREHLTECASCQALAGETRDLQRWFVTPPEEPIPAGFAERVVAAAFDGQTAVASGPRGLVRDESSAQTGEGKRYMQGFLLQMTALAALLLVALGFALAGKQASESQNMYADEASKESALEDLDKLNALEAESDPKSESEVDTDKEDDSE